MQTRLLHVTLLGIYIQLHVQICSWMDVYYHLLVLHFIDTLCPQINNEKVNCNIDNLLICIIYMPLNK